MFCLVEFHRRYSQLFTDSSGSGFGNVVMQWHNSLVAICSVLILRMAAFLTTSREALVIT